MNTVVSQFTAYMQDVDPANGNTAFLTGANPVSLNDFIHELRQPLSAIEMLTYLIEVTTTDETLAPKLEQIQNMVNKIHCLLKSAGVSAGCS